LLGLVFGWPSGFVGGLVVAGGIKGEVAEQFVGGGADDADVQVLHQRQDVRSGVFPSDANVVELAAVAQGDGTGGTDLVGADRSWVSADRSPGPALGRAA